MNDQSASEEAKKLFKKGKVKEVYEIEGTDELEFLFTDNISVFDKIIPTEVPHKGETLCRTSTYWFEHGKNLGIQSHFLKLIPPNRMLVKKVDIIKDYSKLTPTTTNYLIPIEVICRHYIAGSLNDRIKRGKVAAESLGFDKGYQPQYGDKLPEPFIEVTTKLEPVDRLLTNAEAKEIAGLTDDDFNEIQEVLLKLDETINTEVKSRGLIHVDGKKEFAYDADRSLMLIDTFGTADEDRFWDAEKYEQHEFVEISKEFVRQYYRKISYYDELVTARETQASEPDIPPLPAEVTQEVSELYIDLFEKITGEQFK
ncbi:MAG: phosphoribosylaminoimidazolesuccinocarboxamide synthase [Thermoplasmata archaeon]|nr:phosphoribosylaminoimidazolesuccinocarboxamide synthase [Thermoplasmata archaeon]